MKAWIIAAAISAPCTAHADPCEGRLPKAVGEQFAGQVRYIVDGDGLCVGTTADPSTWIEVRLADFNAPELRDTEGVRAKNLLAGLALNMPATCTVTRGRSGRVLSFDRVFAICRIRGVAIGEAMRAAGAPQGGN